MGKAETTRDVVAHRAMNPCRKIESPAPESKRQKAIRCFRGAVRARDEYTTHVGSVGLSASDYESDGLFAAISDDVLALILKYALAPARGTVGLKYFEHVDGGSNSVLAMACSCKRFAIMIHDLCPELRIEALARSCTRVLPEDQSNTFAFSEQMRSELLSCDSLKMLRVAHSALTLHCAKDCCRRARRMFNKDVRKGRVFSRPSSPTMSICAPEENQLVSIADNCSLQDANNNGNVVFMYLREKLSKVAVHGDERGRRFRDIIARYELDYMEKPNSQKPTFKRTSTLEVDSDVMSAPLSVRTSPCGNFVVFTRVLHEIDPEASLPFSSAFLWHKTWDRAIEVTPVCYEGIGCEVLSVQDVWFRDPEEYKFDDVMLVVAWSTEFYHSSGHFVGSNALVLEGPQYMFSSYFLDHETLEHPEHESTSWAYNGSLLTCKPCSKGNKVLTLTKQSSILNGFRCVHLHDIIKCRCLAVEQTYIECGEKGPVAASISPSGDVVVVICKTQKSVKATVCWKTAEAIFTRVANVDITPWLGLYSGDDADFPSDLVKASVDIQFSPCSRFFAVVDRHPLFGAKPEGHGAVIVDTAMRGMTNKLRPFPLFSTEDQCPRSFQWTKRGVFLMPPGTDENSAIGSRGGSICLFCPTTTGFM